MSTWQPTPGLAGTNTTRPHHHLSIMGSFDLKALTEHPLCGAAEETKMKLMWPPSSGSSSLVQGGQSSLDHHRPLKRELGKL